jgi:hypothetical protein
MRKEQRLMPKRYDAFIETQYLNNGKGPASRMIIISPDRLEQVIDLANEKELIKAETLASDIVSAVEDYCEDLDVPNSDKDILCRECGDPCVVNEDGTSNHIDDFGGVDHDKDAEHVALPEGDEYLP